MSAAASASDPIHQRAHGEVALAVKQRGDATVLDRLRQAGSAKAHLPRGIGCEAVLLNTAGGLTGGDRFAWRAEAAEGCDLTLTTQAAERVYRSAGGAAEVEATLTLAAGARLDWLPQETILFDGGALRRSLTVEMAEDARLLAVEPLVLGRAAMGETVRGAFLRDAWRVRRGGQLVYADALRLCGDVQALTGLAAALGGARACATLLWVAPDAPDRLDAMREALGTEGGASAWDGRLVARVIAADGAALRAVLLRAMAVLRPAPPRAWTI